MHGKDGLRMTKAIALNFAAREANATLLTSEIVETDPIQVDLLGHVVALFESTTACSCFPPQTQLPAQPARYATQMTRQLILSIDSVAVF